MTNKAVVFDYENSWMIVYYEGTRNKKYWSCDEDEWDEAWNFLCFISDLEIIRPKFDTYEEIIEFMKSRNTEIFTLTEEDFKELRLMN